MPGQTRTNRNCSRNLSPVTSIKPCVQNEEDSIENKGKSCKEIMEICINKEYGEDLPRYMLSPNKMDIMVPALKDIDEALQLSGQMVKLHCIHWDIIYEEIEHQRQ